MTIKKILLTSAAIVLTAGAVQAQESPSSRPDPAPLAPSAGSPSTPPSASPSAGGSASGDVSGKSSLSSTVGTSGISASSLQEIKDDTAIISAFDMNVKKLKGMDIVGSDGKKIGEIDKVLADSSNQPKAVTVDAGGFLGIGGHEVVLGLDKLSKGSNDKELKTALTKDEVNNLEKYEAKRDAGPNNRGNVATGAGGQPATSIPAK